MAILKDLIVHGSSRFLNKIYASEIQTPLIEAEAGIIKKLKANDATVVGLLDVKGQLHTNSWSNSNIATIDGSFYITPTIESASGTVSITASSLAFSGTNYAVTSLYLGDGSSITWPRYSKVLVTGQILSNGEWIPLGTLLGQLNSAATATSISINSIKDNKNQTSNVLATFVSNGTTSSDYRNLKVSLYQRASSSTAFYPLGIYMTATGTNGRTFLDIYGGVEALSNSNNYGGFAEPNVRIGNLQGLPNVGGQTPSGWGIYTDNGYFKGIIAADKGYIGSGSRYWVIGNYEDGSNSSNDRSYIYNGTNSTTSIVEGIYLGTDGIRNYKDSTHYVTIKNGVISALGVDLSGKITATSGTIGGASITNGTLIVGNANINDINASKINAGDIAAARIQTNLISAINAKVNDLSALTATIGGFQIDSSSVHTKNVVITSNVDNSIALSSADFTRTINSTSRTGLRFAIGDKFGVTGDGTIYASNVDLKGKIIATSGTIGGASITDGTLYITDANISGTISGNHIDASSISIGNLNGANNYAQKSYVDDAVNDIEIGGRNLLKGSNVVNTSLSNSLVGGTATQTIPSGTIITLSVQVDADNVVWSSSGNKRIGVASLVVKDGGGNQYIEAWAAMTGRTGIGIDKTFDTSFHGRVKSTYTLQGELPLDKAFNLYTQSVTSGTVKVSRPKLEIGNKATDWTPAPEDTQESINNAAKTATSYITYINAENGIKIHNAQDTLNYLQLNSTAISMYQEKRNEQDDDDNELLSNEVLRIDSSGTRIGKVKGPHFLLANDKLMGYGNNNNVYFEVGKGDNIITQLFFGDGSRTSFGIGSRIKQVIKVKKGNNIVTEGTDYNIDVVSIWYNVYFKEKPSLNSTITVSYKGFYKDFIYNTSSSSSDVIINSTDIKIRTNKSYLADKLQKKSSGDSIWTSYNINNSATIERENLVGIRLTSVPQAGAKIYYYEGSGTDRMLFLGTSTGQTGQNGDLFYFSSATVVNNVSPLGPYTHAFKIYSNTTTEVSYNEEYDGNYIYSFNYSFIQSGDQIKLSYSVEEHSDLTPDTITENYTWDSTHNHPANSMLSIPFASQIISITVNGVTLSENIDYVTDNNLKVGYLIFNTAPSANEEIEIEFVTQKYNSYYDSTYFNFSNMNSEDAIKGIGAASFGSDNINKGVFCLAEGVGNIVTGYASHVEGCNNIATGSHTHVGGSNSFASGENAFVHGDGLKATYLNSAAFGFYNSPDNQVFSIGKGGSKNSFSINKDGNIQFGGQLLAGTTYADKKPLFTFDTLVWQGQSIPKNGSWTRTGYQLTGKPGYKAIGISGIGIYDGTGGANAAWCIPMRCYVWTASPYDLLDIYIWNQNTTSATSNTYIYVKILFIADTAI